MVEQVQALQFFEFEIEAILASYAWQNFNRLIKLPCRMIYRSPTYAQENA